MKHNYFGIHVNGFSSTFPSASHFLHLNFSEAVLFPSIRLSDKRFDFYVSVSAAPVGEATCERTPSLGVRARPT